MKKVTKTLLVLLVVLTTIISPFNNASAYGVPELLKDINTRGNGTEINSDMGSGVTLGSVAILDICTDEYGCEPWVTDGTEGGTDILKNIGVDEEGSSLNDLTAVGDYAIFSARESEDSDEILWVTDGTTEGTRKLESFDGEEFVDGADDITVATSTFFFVTDISGSDELWVSDGTDVGTVEVAEVNEYLAGLEYENQEIDLEGITDGRLFMVLSDDESSGTTELFAIDINGTNLVEIDHQGALSNNAYMSDSVSVDGDFYYVVDLSWNESEFYVVASTSNAAEELYDDDGFLLGRIDELNHVGDKVFFEGCTSNGYEDCEPWVTDGTVDGTERLLDIAVGSNYSSNVNYMASDGTYLYFDATNEDDEHAIWRTDGTTGGTISAYPLSSEDYYSDTAILVDDVLYFSYTASGSEENLWKLVGMNTFLPVFETEEGIYPQKYTHIGNGQFVFSAIDPQLGRELWVTDGTEEGTEVVADLTTTTEGSSGEDYISGIELNDLFYFAATDNEYGRELWVTDGTEEGTEIFADLKEGIGSSQPRQFLLNGDEFYFIAYTGEDMAELWKTDGDSVTLIAGEDDGYESISYPVIYNGDLWFLASDSGVDSLHKYDGTVVTKVGEGVIDNPELLTVAGDSMYFQAYDMDTSNIELWVSDGTSVTVVHDADGYFENTSKYNYKSFEGKLFFTMNTNDFGQEIWYTDGTAEGSGLLKDVYEGPSYTGSDDMGVAGDLMYFEGSTPDTGSEVWVTDGTPEGTRMVVDLTEGTDSSYPDYFTNIGSLTYFSAYIDGHRRLWVTDGTEEGTREIKDFNGGSGDPNNLKAIGPNLYFTASETDTGREMWISDGTTNGTEIIYDFYEGYNGSNISDYFTYQDNLIVFASSQEYGNEPWIIGDVDMTEPVDEEPEPEPEPEEEESSGGGRSSGRRSRVGTSAPTTSVSQTTQNSSVSSRSFSRDLQGGSVGDDVRDLQRFLNARTFTVAQTGPGSMGNETTVFGPATRDALARFQAANGLPSTGYFGPATRALITSLTSGVNAVSPTTATSPVVTYTGSVRDLQSGDSGDDVKSLQAVLMAAGFEISAGATGLFGSQTKAALAAYQAANGITPAAGYFGPATRAKMTAGGLSGLWW